MEKNPYSILFLIFSTSFVWFGLVIVRMCLYLLLSYVNVLVIIIKLIIEIYLMFAYAKNGVSTCDNNDGNDERKRCGINNIFRKILKLFHLKLALPSIYDMIWLINRRRFFSVIKTKTKNKKKGKVFRVYSAFIFRYHYF